MMPSVTPLAVADVTPGTPLAPLTALSVRDATSEDNAALLEITAACPMEGDVSLCIDRAPDFFALNRLEGERWRVAVVEHAHGSPVGCIAATSRRAWLDGRVAEVGYLSDFKVVPGHRGGRAADALAFHARDAMREWLGDDAPVFLTILDGNCAMERRARGPRGVPSLRRFATLRSHSIPLLWRRRPPDQPSMRVERGSAAAVEEMIALWSRVAPRRQLAPVFDAESFAAWIAAAPGLDLSHYLLARDGSGRLAGFIAFWDQQSFKQLRVLRYSARLGAARHLVNAIARVGGGVPLPGPGKPLRYATALHACVPEGRADVLRALVLAAYEAHREEHYAFLTVGLDAWDPLSAALGGLLAQPTDVGAYVSSARGAYDGPPLDSRPLHFEIALV
ncbi:MAG TPA: hypothetical protein VMM18_13770 [Gemmatimonadaceae bacterium]|nr:hypothetical protein [Gemmatimonadaceae bacterium]